MSGQLEGTITSITGHPMSGLWTLHFSNGKTAHVESGFGIRQLVACFGSFASIKGKRITYSVDDLGVLEGFSPVEED